MFNPFNENPMTIDNEETWTPVVAFPDQSPNFVYGFEAGQIWSAMQILKVVDTHLSFTTNRENREVIQRMAVHLGYEVEVGEIADGWDETILTNVSPEREKPNPHGLRVVK
jgi:hypothetical protein